MKKILIGVMAIVFMASIQANANTDRPIAIDQIPAAAKTFIAQTFPDVTVAYAKIDKGLFKTSYDVHMSDGTKIEFDGSGQLIGIDD